MESDPYAGVRAQASVPYLLQSRAEAATKRARKRDRKPLTDKEKTAKRMIVNQTIRLVMCGNFMTFKQGQIITFPMHIQGLLLAGADISPAPEG